MKWFVIIVVVLIVAALIWLRMARQEPRGDSVPAPHRLDESIAPPVAPSSSADSSGGGGESFFAGVDPSAGRGESPGSDFAAEPGITDDQVPPGETGTPGANGRSTP